MTYDHNKGSGLPNAPYDWVKEVMSSLVTVRGIRNFSFFDYHRLMAREGNCFWVFHSMVTVKEKQ